MALFRNFRVEKAISALGIHKRSYLYPDFTILHLCTYIRKASFLQTRHVTHQSISCSTATFKVPHQLRQQGLQQKNMYFLRYFISPIPFRAVEHYTIFFCKILFSLKNPIVSHHLRLIVIWDTLKIYFGSHLITITLHRMDLLY